MPTYPQPFRAFPGIVERLPHWVDLQVWDQPDVLATRLWGSVSLEDAYGALATSGLGGTGGTAFAEATRGTSFVSKTWRGRPLVEESHRRMTRFYFNPDDFVNPALPSPMPPDDAMLFVRLQQHSLAAGGYLAVDGGAALNPGTPIRGPILVIPPPLFWTTTRPALTLAGQAPNNTGCVLNEVPFIDDTVQAPTPMIIELPKPAQITTIVNTSAASELLVSSGLGLPMAEILPGDSAYFEGSLREIVLAGTGSATFSIHATIALERG